MPRSSQTDKIPHPKREFRGAWLATVANIDWPSRPGLSTAEQQQELVQLLDVAVRLNLNAIIFQVRPAGDAFYASDLEPWSEYLTGTMGKPPAPSYDPLDFMVREAHARGLELHAWFNPYRVRHAKAIGPVSADHISKTRPDLVRDYGGYLWLDPGEPDAAAHSTSVVLDVVRRYDIDAVHFDDYFYPYPVRDKNNSEVPFPDDASWEKFPQLHEKMTRDEWRRQNVNRFIEELSREIKKVKPWVKFGISPFGIWRPGNPPQIQGFDAYAKLYADSRLWQRQGWVDYLAPQLYWRIERVPQSYPVLLNWWQEQNVARRHLWAGNASYKASDDPPPGDRNRWPAAEIVEQVRLTRAQPGASGNIFFNFTSLAKNYGGVADALLRGPYQEPALVPISPWISSDKPDPPDAAAHCSGNSTTVSLRSANGEAPWLWVVRARCDGRWQVQIVPGVKSACAVTHESPRAESIVVSLVNRVGEESEVVQVGLE